MLRLAAYSRLGCMHVFWDFFLRPLSICTAGHLKLFRTWHFVLSLSLSIFRTFHWVAAATKPRYICRARQTYESRQWQPDNWPKVISRLYWISAVSQNITTNLEKLFTTNDMKKKACSLIKILVPENKFASQGYFSIFQFYISIKKLLKNYNKK